MGRQSSRGADRGRTGSGIRNSAAALLAAALAALVVATGCSSGPTTPGTPQQPAAVQALGLVPTGTGSVTVVDLLGMRTRWGLADVDGRLAVDDPRTVDLLRRWGAAGTGPSLQTWLQQLTRAEAGFSPLDIDLEIDLTSPGAPPLTVLRLHDDVDMAAVAQRLVEGGMVRTGPDDAPRFDSEDLGSGAFGRVFLSGVTLRPAEHLLITGPADRWRPPAAGASLLDDPAVRTATAGLPTSDTVVVDAGTQACTPIGSAMTAGRLSAEALRRFQQQVASIGTLPAVSASVVAVTGDTTAEIRTVQADPAATATAATSRKRLLEVLPSFSSGGAPYAELLGTAQLTAEGTVLHWRLQPPRPGVLVRMHAALDVPWSFC